jgi:hypothetical protein
MHPEYWRLGEAVQDRIVAAGYDHQSVDGIAVDLHDLLQAADLIRTELAPEIVASEDLRAAVEKLRQEILHLKWHCNAADRYLSAALESAPG